MQDSLMCNKEKYSDNWETPPEFYEHLLPLVKGRKIWEPFVGFAKIQSIGSFGRSAGGCRSQTIYDFTA